MKIHLSTICPRGVGFQIKYFVAIILSLFLSKHQSTVALVYSRLGLKKKDPSFVSYNKSTIIAVFLVPLVRF